MLPKQDRGTPQLMSTKYRHQPDVSPVLDLIIDMCHVRMSNNAFINKRVCIGAPQIHEATYCTCIKCIGEKVITTR